MPRMKPPSPRAFATAPLAIVVAVSALVLPRPAAADEPRPVWLALSGIASMHHNQLGSLNVALASAGYSTIGSNQPILGIGVEGGIGRLRVAWDSGIFGTRSYRRSSDGARFDVSQASISLDVGYDLLQVSGLSLFPMVGAAGGDIRLQIDPARSPILPEQIALHRSEGEVRRNTWSVRGLVGAEQRISLWKRGDDQLLLVVGLRLGYVHQVSESRWMFEEPQNADLQGGPTVNTSGPFWRVGLGLAGSSR